MIEQISYALQPLSRVAAACRKLAACVMVLGVLAGCSTSKTLEVAPPPPLQGGRYAAIVVDASSGKMLYDSESGAPRYPASLTKMMTLYMVFEAMQQGRITKTTLIPVSADAARQPPTKIGFKPGEAIDVESAIHALTVKSANDVAMAIGEYLGGTEAGFAQMMTRKARQLGMNGTSFANASGLPDPGQRTTARDMAVLGMALRRHFPQYFDYFSARDFDYRGKTVRGHNQLLGRVAGVDGIKTGYIRASGYNIVTSVKTGDKSLVVVVMGADSARARDAQVQNLINAYLPQAGGS
jgi:D-alanyl-D-alanine carboxypeptidase